MKVSLINFNKGEDDKGCLKFCNFLKWSAKFCARKITEGLFRKYITLLQPKLLKGCLESTLRYYSQNY
jgi:hypothetical protein